MIGFYTTSKRNSELRSNLQYLQVVLQPQNGSDIQHVSRLCEQYTRVFNF